MTGINHPPPQNEITGTITKKTTKQPKRINGKDLKIIRITGQSKKIQLIHTTKGQQPDGHIGLLQEGKITHPIIGRLPGRTITTGLTGLKI